MIFDVFSGNNNFMRNCLDECVFCFKYIWNTVHANFNSSIAKGFVFFILSKGSTLLIYQTLNSIFDVLIC